MVVVVVKYVELEFQRRLTDFAGQDTSLQFRKSRSHFLQTYQLAIAQVHSSLFLHKRAYYKSSSGIAGDRLYSFEWKRPSVLMSKELS